MRKTSQILVAAVSLVVVGVAQAGPKVEVTFRNTGTADVMLQQVTSNEKSTYLASNPRPADKVPAGAFIDFDVQRVVSPDVNAAMVRYAAGRKTCAFSTIYQMRVLPGGITKPEWTKSATPSGGATCTATITRINADNSWAVEFTMK